MNNTITEVITSQTSTEEVKKTFVIDRETIVNVFKKIVKIKNVRNGVHFKIKNNCVIIMVTDSYRLYEYTIKNVNNNSENIESKFSINQNEIVLLYNYIKNLSCGFIIFYNEEENLVFKDGLNSLYAKKMEYTIEYDGLFKPSTFSIIFDKKLLIDTLSLLDQKNILLEFSGDMYPIKVVNEKERVILMPRKK